MYLLVMILIKADAQHTDREKHFHIGRIGGNIAADALVHDHELRGRIGQDTRTGIFIRTDDDRPLGYSP